MSPIVFTNEDFKIIDTRHDDPMVVTIEVANFVIMKTLIDQGSLWISFTGKLSRKWVYP